MSNRWSTEDIAKIGIDRISKSSKKDVKVEWANPAVINGKPFIKHTRKDYNKKEQKLQIQIATYLKLKHPEIIFYSDVASGCKLTIGQSVLNKRMQYSRALPDMFISHVNSKYAGLYLELKKDIMEVYRKDGKMRNDQHIIEQNNMLNELEKRGYCAKFGFGFDFTVNLIENYLKIKQ